MHSHKEIVMNFARDALPGLAGARNAVSQAAILLVALVLAACGGGASTTSIQTDPSAACDPANPSTFDECGSVVVAITDADGDFVNYTVDILSLELETANGRTVETLPRRTRMNFADYVDLSEVMTVATVPPAIYVAGTIRLSYDDAEVHVAFGDGSKETIIKDLSGNILGETALRIQLSNRDQLRVNRRATAFLQLDFDLDASHEVDVSLTPAEAVTQQFILAEVSPVDEKQIRVRGPLVEVNEDESSYVVAIRPFHDRVGDHGRMKVYTTDDTEFEVDGVSYIGSEGLRALAAAGQGTPTVAGGTLNLANREFTAEVVLAGSSVPGHDRAAVRGNVLARDGNFLTIRGATVIPHDRRAHFHDDVVVEIGPDTTVFKDGDGRDDQGIGAISIGQRVTVYASRPDAMPAATDSASPQILFDATQGAVRMHVTQVSGIVNTVMTGQTDITLHAIDRRRVGIFDFSGTGLSPDLDADPDNYEVATGSLSLADFAAGKPIVARGFPEAFGAAPPDFTGRTIIDYTDVRSALGVGWGAAGTFAPFLRTDIEGLLLDNQNGDIDVRHHIKHGPVLIDLTALDSNTLIVPRETGRMLFIIKTADSLRQYSDFGDFIADLTTSLNGSTTARSMFARGQYDIDSNVFTAHKVGIYLLEP
jgi:hypothetical protein